MSTQILTPSQGPFFVGRRRTHDELMTFDRMGATHDSAGNAIGKRFGQNFTTFDGKTVDSTGAFLVGELERLDQTPYEPLVEVSWGRDIDLREDVTLADEVSSFTKRIYGASSGLGAGQGIGTGKNWIAKDTTQIPGVSLDIAKYPFPLTPWAMEVAFTIFELESAAKLGRPVDAQKYDGLKLKHQMDIDEQVYVGDTNLGFTGLVNNTTVSAANVATVSGNTTWASKILAGAYDAVTADINTVINTAWKATGWSVIPERLLLPPDDFGLIVTQKVSSAGNVSILKYIQDNNVYTRSTGRPLQIFPVKWLNGAGAGGTIGTGGATHDRMVAYTKQKKYVRFPMTMLQRTPLQYDSIWHKSVYFCRLGVIELVYPESMAYADGLS